MGYRKKAKTYTLKWADDHELHGLEVVVTGLTVAKMLDMSERVAQVSGAQEDGGEVASEAKEMFSSFARCLVRWNLEDEEGRPVPATFEGIASQDLDFVLDLIVTWMEAVSGVPGDSPLPETSDSGLAALEASLQMAPLSPSLTS